MYLRTHFTKPMKDLSWVLLTNPRELLGSIPATLRLFTDACVDVTGSVALTQRLIESKLTLTSR